MAQKYYPLLKFGFQETGGGGEAEQIAALQESVSVLQQQAAMLQTALNTLKGNKITKCFTAAELENLENNEIFEWQGVTTTIDGTQFVNGYFYKKIVGQETLPSGTTYFLYDTNSPTITQNGYVFAPGNYYHLNTITPSNDSNFFNYALYKWDGITRYYYILARDVNLQVGDLVWDNQEYTFVTVVNISELNNTTLSNGDVITSRGTTGGNFVEIIETKIADGTAFSFIRSNMGRVVVHYTLIDNVFTLIDWFFVYVLTETTTTPVNVGVDTYTQTNTQPGSSYTLPIAAANVLGGVKIGSGLSIDANGVLSASGSGGGTVYPIDIESSNTDINVDESAVAYYYNGLVFYYVPILVHANISGGAVFKFYTKSTRPYQFNVLSLCTLDIVAFDANGYVCFNQLTLTQGSNFVTLKEYSQLYNEMDYWLYGSFPCTLTEL